MRGCSRLTLVLSRRAVTGAPWAEVARTVARVVVARVVERVAVGERAVGRAVVGEGGGGGAGGSGGIRARATG